jgi:hypothetical protein
MVKSSVADETRFPIIKELTHLAYKLGETIFPPEWIPEGDYNGVVKELREKMKNYKIQLTYLPETSDNLLVYLPSLLLPSGFNVTPFPISLWSENFYSNLNKNPVGHDYVYEFCGDCTGMWEGNKEQKQQCIKQLIKLFEPDETNKFTHGIDAIRLRKIIKRLSYSQLEKSERLLKKHGFKDAIFETTSYYTAGMNNKFIEKWDIRDANRVDNYYYGYALSLSYSHPEESEGDSNLSILLYSRGSYPRKMTMLTSDSLKFLEELAQLF